MTLTTEQWQQIETDLVTIDSRCKASKPRIEKILDLLAKGNFRRTAALQSGVAPETLRDWMRKSETLRSLSESAETLPEVEGVALFRKAAKGGNVYALVEFMKRRFRHAWGDTIRINVRDLDDETLLRAIAAGIGGGSDEATPADTEAS